MAPIPSAPFRRGGPPPDLADLGVLPVMRNPELCPADAGRRRRARRSQSGDPQPADGEFALPPLLHSRGRGGGDGDEQLSPRRAVGPSALRGMRTHIQDELAGIRSTLQRATAIDRDALRNLAEQDRELMEEQQRRVQDTALMMAQRDAAREHRSESNASGRRERRARNRDPRRQRQDVLEKLERVQQQQEARDARFRSLMTIMGSEDPDAEQGARRMVLALPEQARHAAAQHAGAHEWQKFTWRQRLVYTKHYAEHLGMDFPELRPPGSDVRRVDPASRTGGDKQWIAERSEQVARNQQRRLEELSVAQQEQHRQNRLVRYEAQQRNGRKRIQLRVRTKTLGWLILSLNRLWHLVLRIRAGVDAAALNAVAGMVCLAAAQEARLEAARARKAKRKKRGDPNAQERRHIGAWTTQAQRTQVTALFRRAFD
eukprot:TRINITY_DN48097_c0_g1_i1.p1 TRINITY_DN48097_c0_g1~~TRINITY_DN48097_c0_g1_i1.p1  ORF type:complete len:455 (+),score=123.79 TRINITY_DN48097_c0_g1_i1:77-1366(+)